MLLPLSEIDRQIRLGMCRVAGQTVTDQDFGVIVGVTVEIGQTKRFVV
jgi:hypothetical protein